MTVLLTMLCALMCSLGYRLRGGLWGGLGLGATMARIVWWGGSCGLSVALWAPVWWLPLAIAAAAWLGSTSSSFGAIDLGNHDADFWTDFGGLTLRGLCCTVPVVIALSLAGVVGWPVLAAGLMCAPAYAAGWAIPSRTPGLHQGPEAAEALFGGLVGLGFALAFVL